MTRLPVNELNELESIITGSITFINEALISEKHFLFAEKLTANIDPDDTPFVALTKHLKGTLWTGDKKLITGLRAQNFKQVISTTELSGLFDKLES